MTDQEKAEEYSDNLDLVKERNPELKTNDDFIKQAYLDGLAEGRKEEDEKLFNEWCKGETPEPHECPFLIELREQIERMKPYCKSLCKSYSKSVVMGNDCINGTCRNCNKWEMTNG